MNITEEDIKNAKYKFGNISILSKDNNLWLHEENFLMQFNPGDVEEFFQKLYDAIKLTGGNSNPNIEYPFDNLMNFISLKNGYYNTGGLFGQFVELSELIKPTQSKFGSKGTFPFCLIQICRCLIEGKNDDANSYYSFYLRNKKEEAKKEKEENKISKILFDGKSVNCIRKWDEEDKKGSRKFIKNLILIEYKGKLYKGSKYDDAETYFIREII